MAKDFIPDDQFVADEEKAASPGTPPAQPSATPTANFIPDEDFVPDAGSMTDDEQAEETIRQYDTLQKEYGGIGQQALAGLEGVAEGLAGPLATGAEVALGIPREDILKRKKANPATNIAAQGAGLVGGALIGTTEARGLVTLGSLAEKAGAKAAAALIPQTGTVAAKIGSQAVKGAIENMVVQGSSEVSKMILKDPDQSVQTALVDVGLAGLLGGGANAAVGSVAPLWKATVGKQTGGVLEAISNKLGGIEGIDSDPIRQAIRAGGLEGSITPEIEASLLGNPVIKQEAQILMDSATRSGVEYQEALKGFKSKINDNILSALGKTPDDIAALENLNAHEVGSNIRDIIKNDIKAKYDPLAKNFEQLSERFKNTSIPGGIKTQLGEDLAKLGAEMVDAESPAAKFIERQLKNISKIDNLEQMRKLSSEIFQQTDGIAKQELWEVGRAIRNSLSNAEESALNWAVEKEAPELFTQHLETNKGYRALKEEISGLNDRIKAGDRAGPKTFLKNLDNLDPETLLNRLNPTGKADIIAELSEKFPGVAEQVRNYHLSKILKTAASRAQPGQTLAPNSIFKQIFESDRMSPQMRDFLVKPEAQAQIKALNAVMEHLPEKINKSGTAQGVDALMKFVPGSAVALSSMLNGANILTAGIVGHLTKMIGRDAPDAVRLGLLKFLGSSKEIEPGAFKATVDYIHAAMKGEKAIANATKSVFKAGRMVMPQAAPTEKDRKKLDKQLSDLQVDNTPLLKTGGDATHYMEDHGGAMGQTASSAVNYLNSLRPSTTPTSPLGKPLPVNPIAKAKYDRALDIAQQPLLVLEKIKNGTIIPSDVQALQNMYPALYDKFTKQLTSQMTDMISKGKSIPYKTRIGLSMFMAQPLDGTMTPQSIMAAQPQAQAAPQQPPQPQGTLRPSQQGAKGLSKLPGAYQTPSQNREADRQKH